MSEEGFYSDLFKKYVARLDWAVAQAVGNEDLERGRLVESFEGDQARVEEELADTGGIATDPYVLGAIREYWLACAALNERAPLKGVEPSAFILDRLKQVRPDLADVIARLPYWPIGQDEKGRWV